MSEGRFALLVATGRYDNSALRRLRSPAQDADSLAKVLKDRQIGDFAVRKVSDQPNGAVSRAIESFFRDRSTRDLLLLHISCHGIKNDDGELYFAARDTDPELLDSTAVSAAFLRTQMQRCRARSIVVLLDCCYSGAFLPGLKGDTTVQVTERLAGTGRAVLTATNRFEYAWEGNHLNKLEPESSWFTRAVIEGLRTGQADRDGDGFVSVDELYAYVYERMHDSRVKQRPQRWSELEYQVLIARSAAHAEARPWPSAHETARRPTPTVRTRDRHVDPRPPLPASIPRAEPFGPVPQATLPGQPLRAAPSPAEPLVWGRVPRRNRRFTGRQSLLGELRQLLADAGPDGAMVTLRGMVGVGKTQLALEYVYRFRTEYDVVWWVSAETRVACRQALAELAPALGLTTGAELGDRLRTVRDSLGRGSPSARWLLVLDGANEPDDIADLVPAGVGHVLITSRNPGWDEHGSTLPLDVPLYGRRESIAFVHSRAPRLTESEADRLAEMCEDLPLLLDQTAGWLDDFNISLDEYSTYVRDGFDTNTVKLSADYPFPFRSACLHLLNHLNDTAPSALALLRLFTFFAPGFVPIQLVKSVPRESLPQRLEVPLGDPLQWHLAVKKIRRYSLVSVAADTVADSGDSLYLHRTVHQVVRAEVPELERPLLRTAVHRGLAAADPREPSDSRTWPEYARILPHLQSADACTSDDPDVQRLILNCLRYLRSSGDYRVGVSLAEQVLQAWRPLLGGEHRQVWILICHYADLLRAAGDHSRTEALDRAAVDGLAAQLGTDEPQYLHAALGLAADLRNLARYTESLELSETVMTTCLRVLGDEDSLSLSARSSVGFGLALLGRYNEALEVGQWTLAAHRRLMGDEHPSTLLSELSFATDLRLLGRYRESKEIQEMNVRQHHLVMGTDHPQSLWAQHNLALCHVRNGDHDQASQIFSELPKRARRILGDAHPHTLAFASSQSCFSREYGDIEQAGRLSGSVVAGYEAVHADGHPYIAGCRANHALILSRLGDREQARALVEQALRDMSVAVGENHPWTLGCAINASALRGLVGELESAAELSKDTVDRAARALGTLHPLTLSARVAQAADQRALRDSEQARKLEDEALTGLAQSLGSQHALTLAARRRERLFWDFEPLPS